MEEFLSGAVASVAVVREDKMSNEEIIIRKFIGTAGIVMSAFSFLLAATVIQILSIDGNDYILILLTALIPGILITGSIYQSLKIINCSEGEETKLNNPNYKTKKILGTIVLGTGIILLLLSAYIYFLSATMQDIFLSMITFLVLGLTITLGIDILSRPNIYTVKEQK